MIKRIIPFEDLSIQKKLLYAYSPLIVLSMFVMYLIFQNITKQSVTEQVCKSKMDTLHYIAEKIKIMNKDIVSLSNIYYFDKDIRMFLMNSYYRSEYEKVSELKNIEEKIRYTNNNFHYLHFNTTLLGFNNKFYSTDKKRSYDSARILPETLLKEFMKDKNKIIYTETYNNGDKFVISAIRYVTDVYTGRPLGLLIFDFEEKTFYNIYKDSITENSYIFIVSGNGNYISSADKNHLTSNCKNENFFRKMSWYETGYFSTKFNNKDVLVSFSRLSEFDWYIVDITLMKSVFSGLHRMMKFIYAFTLILLIITVLISYMISTIITDPLKSLVVSMKNVKMDNFPVSLKTQRKDEIGELTRNYIAMTETIDTLIKELKHENELKRKAEIQMLQYQINPHFLYNTLNSMLVANTVIAQKKFKPTDIYRLAGKITSGVLIIFFVFVMVTPFIWMVLTAFKAPDEVIRYPLIFIPKKLLFSNFSAALNRFPFGRFFINSLIVAVVVTITQLFFSTLSGFAFAKYRFPGRYLIFLLILTGMMVPAELKMIPTYLYVQKLKWIDSYQALILPAIMAPFGIFLMRQFVDGIPDELVQAARIDGCPEFKIFANVILPLCKPPMAALTIIVFMGQWNDFVWPLIVTNSTEMRTIQLGLAMFQVENGVLQYNYLMAATVISVLPVVLVFLLMQKYFIQGIALSGIKS